MEYTKIESAGIMVSKIALGCWAMGAGSEWGETPGDEVFIETVNTAIEGGINFFDTAMAYGQGHSEEVLGRALGGLREKVVISSKGSTPGLTLKNARKSVESSLSRLRTDYIDVYFIHWPNPDIPVEEPVEQLMKLKSEGKIRAIGVSNYTVGHLERALKAGDIDIVQPCYSLYWRHIEKDLLPFCRERNIGVMSYSSIAQGLLTGKFTKDWKFDDSDMRKNTIPLFKSPTYEMAIDATEKIKGISEKYGKTTVQTAINWVIGEPGITCAIVGAKSPVQAAENIGAAGWRLDPEDRRAIGGIAGVVADTVSGWDTMYHEDDPRLIMKV
ncbi:MAG: aldo/keto reductase [Clostridia bacterium]